MKVKDLLNILNDYEDDVEVVLASDEEWNTLRKLHSVDESAVVSTDGYELETVHPDDMMDYIGENVSNVLILW